MASNNLQSLSYSNTVSPTLAVLDQLLVPDEKVYIPILNVEAAWSVIRTMQIRGAPLIAIVACLGLAVDIGSNDATKKELEMLSSVDETVKYIDTKINYLRTSRPTAVNLFNAMDELSHVITKTVTGLTESISLSDSKATIVKAIIEYAEFMLQRDVNDNKSIGNHGANALLAKTTTTTTTGGQEKPQIKMITICNTGSLATAGYGTALGVARALHERNQLQSIYCMETRPYNQGSRLTAFEILQEKMPNGTLICDSAAAALMRTKGVDACVVGADRVCANGDTANKIGTYQLAVVAHTHGVPFYVASPFTTLDTALAHGDAIEIEERPAKEMLESSKAPTDMPVWNPAFDVTPAKFITGIITEKGVIEEKKEDGTFDIAAFVSKHSN